MERHEIDMETPPLRLVAYLVVIEESTLNLSEDSEWTITSAGFFSGWNSHFYWSEFGTVTIPS